MGSEAPRGGVRELTASKRPLQRSPAEIGGAWAILCVKWA
jgi:hypothetical protein